MVLIFTILGASQTKLYISEFLPPALHGQLACYWRVTYYVHEKYGEPPLVHRYHCMGLPRSQRIVNMRKQCAAQELGNPTQRALVSAPAVCGRRPHARRAIPPRPAPKCRARNYARITHETSIYKFKAPRSPRSFESPPALAVEDLAWRPSSSLSPSCRWRR